MSALHHFLFFIPKQKRTAIPFIPLLKSNDRSNKAYSSPYVESGHNKINNDKEDNMTGGRIILNQLLDIGGIATKNNFYSANAKTLKGSLLQIHKYFNEWETSGLIKQLPSVINTRNKRQEVFYAITAKGANYIDRREDYKIRSQPKSPYNIMHESMIRDIAVSFLRNYPEYNISIRYDLCFEGIRPDIVIKMKNKNTNQENIFFVEIERKKTIDRVINEKLLRYEDMFSKLNFRKHNLNAPVKVLVVYSNLDFNCFFRPQEYNSSFVQSQIAKLNKQVYNLAKASKSLSSDRYRFLSFHKFPILHQPIWLTPQCIKTKILS